MTHTPGPWHLKKDDEDKTYPDGSVRYPWLWAWNEDESKVIFHHVATDQEREDNARLMVTAPELLHACKEAVALIEALDGMRMEEYAIIKAAIAHAEAQP